MGTVLIIDEKSNPENWTVSDLMSLANAIRTGDPKYVAALAKIGVEHNGIEEAEYWHSRTMAECETLSARIAAVTKTETDASTKQPE